MGHPKEIFSEDPLRVLKHGRRKIVILQRIQTNFYKYRRTDRFEVDYHNQNDVNGSHTFGNENLSDGKTEHDTQVSGEW